MSYKGIIFDLDGVICSTDEYHYLAWRRMADTLGVYFDRTINNRLRGVSLHLCQLRFTRCGERRTFVAFYIYRESLRQMSPADLTDEVRETLLTLRGRGLKLAIGSSSKNTPLILKQLGLADFFDAVSDGNNITRSKPDPQVFLMAAEFLGLAPDVSVYWGRGKSQRGRYQSDIIPSPAFYFLAILVLSEPLLFLLDFAVAKVPDL